MGFWSWLFGSAEARAEKAAAEELRKRQHERRMIDYHVALVREALLNPTHATGFALKICDQYEDVVLDAVAQMATVPYAVYRTADEDMVFRGECRIHVAYIQFPLGSVLAAAAAPNKSSTASNGYS
jgi:hypothetical protein